MPVAYTDLFNEALDDLAAKLNTVTGLTVVTEPTQERILHLISLLHPHNDTTSETV